MQNGFSIGKKEMKVSYVPAKIIHSNKYNSNSGFFFFNMFFSSFWQDLVFHIEETEQDFPITLKNVNIAAYPGQQVKLITIDSTAVGFIDNTTKEYSYFTNHLPQVLEVGLSIKWLVILGIVALTILYLLFNFGTEQAFIAFLFFIPIAWWLYNRIFNYYVERKIDKIILSGEFA